MPIDLPSTKKFPLPSDAPLSLPLVGCFGSCGRRRCLMQLFQFIVDPQSKLGIGGQVSSWHLMLLRRLDAHLHQFLQRLRQTHSAQESWLEGSSAQEDVFTEYLEVVVLLNVRAGLVLLVAHSDAGVEVAVLVGVALDAPRQPLVQLALHINMLGTLVLQSPFRRGAKAIHLHLAHFEGFGLHFVQSENVLHYVEGMLEALQAI